MKTYKRILAAVDFSKYSKDLVEQAASMAVKMEAELILLNVINQRDIDFINYSHQILKFVSDKFSIDILNERLRKDREKKMEDLIQKCDMVEAESRFMIRTGIPLQEIINAAKEEKADLVFVASKGRTDMTEVIVGSTTLKLVRHCPVTLVIVKQNKTAKTV